MTIIDHLILMKSRAEKSLLPADCFKAGLCRLIGQRMHALIESVGNFKVGFKLI